MRNELRRVAVVFLGLPLVLGVLSASLTPAGANVASPVAPRAALPAPTITSTGRNVYVSGMATNYVGAPGQFTLSDPGSTVTGYYYGLGGFPSTFVAAGSSGTAVLAITPFDQSELDLQVYAVNGSESSLVSTFMILTKANRNIATLGWWKLSAGSGKTAVDSTGHSHTATLSGDASLGCGSVAAPDAYHCWMILDGHGAARTSPALLPIVGLGTSFSISAWVNVSACKSTCAALSQDASKVSAFTLKYDATCAAGPHGCWVFSMRPADNPATTLETAKVSVGTTSPAGKWVQLTGLFNAGHGQLTLYVNGVQKAQAASVPWSSTPAGPVRIGSGFQGTSPWVGKLSNACVFYGVLQPSDVTLLYKGDAAHPHNGCAALHAIYP